jgi:hypothetical protein
MTSFPQMPVPCHRSARLAVTLDRRSAPRLALLFLGAVLARGRRTVFCQHFKRRVGVTPGHFRTPARTA